MAFSGNNERMFQRNPFSTSGNQPYTPRQQPGPALAGMLAPQAGVGPYANDALVPSGPTASNSGPFDNIQSLQDVVNFGPSTVLPYVAPPTAGIIEQMLGLQNQYSSTALPLLAQLLGLEQSTYNTYEQYFAPEQALRTELLRLLAGQNNDALEAILGLQDQIRPPRSSTSFFAGF